MQCKECGESAKDITLRYCENCGAKMPVAPTRGTSTRPTLLDDAPGRTVTRDASESPARPGTRPPVREEPARLDDSPPYDGPAALRHVPGHSPSVLGIGLLVLAVACSLLLAGVGAFWSLFTVLGGWLVTAREMRDAGQKNGLVDWVPESLMRPAVPALYTVVAVALAIRMLGVGLTPLLWLLGAGLLAADQYRKVFAGEEGFSRLFEPRQLLRGTAVVAVLGVIVCLVALFLTWVPGRAPRSSPAGVTRAAPAELRVQDRTPPSSDFVYTLLDQPQDAGWDQPGAVTLELLLLGVLALLALRPEVEVPGWLRFAPIGVVVLGLGWTLVFGGLVAGALLFLVGLGVVGFASVIRAFMPQVAEAPYPEDELAPEGSFEEPPYDGRVYDDEPYQEQPDDGRTYEDEPYPEQPYDGQPEGEPRYEEPLEGEPPPDDGADDEGTYAERPSREGDDEDPPDDERAPPKRRGQAG